MSKETDVDMNDLSSLLGLLNQTKSVATTARSEMDHTNEAKKHHHALQKRKCRMEMKRVVEYLRLGGLRGSLQPLANPCLFICIDLEAWEFDQNVITELGVSTLDTTHLSITSPKLWHTLIKSSHFRIQEHQHRVNKVHVPGCPDNFNFGASEYVSLSGVVHLLRETFQESKTTGKPILVGHNIESDIKFVQKLGLSLPSLVSDCIDTETLYKAAHRQPANKGLGKLLEEYGIQASNLHNAGNDARYTLEALLAIVWRDLTQRPTAEEWVVRKEIAIRKAVEEAERRIKEQMEGWRSEEDDEPFAAKYLDMNGKINGQNGGRNAKQTPRGGAGMEQSKALLSGAVIQRPQHSAHYDRPLEDFFVRAGRHKINTNAGQSNTPQNNSAGDHGGNQQIRPRRHKGQPSVLASHRVATMAKQDPLVH